MHGQQICTVSQLLPTCAQTNIENQRNSPCDILNGVYMDAHILMLVFGTKIPTKRLVDYEK